MAPVLSEARLQQLSASVKSAGVARSKMVTVRSNATVEGLRPDGGWVNPKSWVPDTYLLPLLRVIEAAAKLEHEAELDAEHVRQFFVQVR